MRELDPKENWALKNWCFWTVVLEKTLESPLDFREIQPVRPKGNQPWIFIGRTDADAPILWPPDEKDWRQEENRMTEDEMVGWHHWLDGHEFEQAPGVGDGQWSLACCSPWGLKESDMTELLNWTRNRSLLCWISDNLPCDLGQVFEPLKTSVSLPAGWMSCIQRPQRSFPILNSHLFLFFIREWVQGKQRLPVPCSIYPNNEYMWHRVP